jgi:hypothetical protein
VRPTAERVARWDARGVRYVHAAVRIRKRVGAFSIKVS